MTLTKDILIKAAEDVQQGMWCMGAWFQEQSQKGSPIKDLPESEVFDQANLDAYLKSYRCAEGSIYLATALLGGDESHALEAIRLANHATQELCQNREEHLNDGEPCVSVLTHNDSHLGNLYADEPDGAFKAGQDLARIFRHAADQLYRLAPLPLLLSLTYPLVERP